MLSIIAVIGKNRELGRDNHLLWDLPEDLKRFRAITSGHPVIMGRKTYQSIGHPLPNRANFVITSDPLYQAEDITVVTSLDEAIEKAKQAPGGDEVFIIGGGSIYQQAMTKADRLYLTLVDDAPQADTFFPEYAQFTKEISREPQEANGLRFTYLTLERNL